MDIINSLIITPEILKLIAEIDEFKGTWKLLGKLAPERLLALKKVATIESVGSSTRIEGAKLSDKQVAILLSQLEEKSFQSRDEEEVAGYAFACQQIYENYQAIPITENSIKQMHQWLLQYSDNDNGHRGKYKNLPIQMEAFGADGKSLGILLETVSPLETTFKMEELISWVNKAFHEKVLHPLIVIGIFIVIFLAIHPFQDGNGRLSRILTTLLMLKSGYLYCPYSSLESIIESNKESYYLSLQKTQKSWQKNTPEWNHWLNFFLNCLQRQTKHLETKIQQENMLLEKLPALNYRIIELLEAHGRLSIREIEILTQANRNTIKKTLSKLVDQKFILKRGIGKGTWYTLFR